MKQRKKLDFIKNNKLSSVSVLPPPRYTETDHTLPPPSYDEAFNVQPSSASAIPPNEPPQPPPLYSQ